MSTPPTTQGGELTQSQSIAFLRLLAHDIKSGIGGADLWVYLLTAEGFAGDREKGEAGVRLALATLDRLALEVGDVARRLAGAALPDPKELQLGGLLTNAATRVNGSGNPRGVMVEIGQLPEALPAVRGGDDELTTAFERLLAFAVSKTPSGGRVRIEVTRDPEWIRIRMPAGSEAPGAVAGLREHLAGLAGTDRGLRLTLPLARDTMLRHGGELEIVQGEAESVIEARLPAGAKSPPDQTPR
jgi:hypothetical protein